MVVLEGDEFDEEVVLTPMIFEKNNLENRTVEKMSVHLPTLGSHLGYDGAIDIARSENEKEYLRALDLLSKTDESDLADTAPMKDDRLFYRYVLVKYRQWFNEHEFPFPVPEAVRISASAAERYAYAIYVALKTVKEVPTKAAAFFRLALPEADRKGMEYRRVEQRLKEAGFYVPDPDRNVAKAIRDAVARIEAHFSKERPNAIKRNKGTSTK